MPTAERLKQLLHYDPATGIFTRKVISAPSVQIGDIAGSQQKNGYQAISVDGKLYLAHRLAWLYMTAEFPKGMLDHCDANKVNNKWDNLREATHTQNLANARRRSDNSSGFKCVSYFGRGRPKPWVSYINCNGKRKRLGYFLTPEDAHAAYCDAASKIFGEFARVV